MQRQRYLQTIHHQFEVHPACALIGPRQAGKTTLAHQYANEAEKQITFFDLENPLDLSRLETPLLSLGALTNQLIVIDEVQKRPDLFSVLRVLIDEQGKERQFLLLGSASKDLIKQSSETLAGRIGYVEVTPFSLAETNDVERLWLRGGFPRSYLANNEKGSYLWRQSYITSYLERDIPNLGFNIPPQQMRRFWLMLAHYHGQIYNSSEIGRSLGISSHTVRRYLDILAGTFMVRVLTPWHENLNKRQVKSPKIYFRDNGILFALSGITSEADLLTHPRLGSFWEGFALEQTIASLSVEPEECYYWATQAGAELDLLVLKKGKRIGFEFKYSDAPRTTKSMHVALEDLKLDHLYIVVPGKTSFPIAEKISVWGLEALELLFP